MTLLTLLSPQTAAQAPLKPWYPFQWGGSKWRDRRDEEDRLARLAHELAEARRLAEELDLERERVRLARLEAEVARLAAAAAWNAAQARRLAQIERVAKAAEDRLEREREEDDELAILMAA